ncbi:MAG: alanine racemase [Deltaproteobacteria bacterium]|nr:alanine racemase [Deltaproteobacteria bacterium]
MTYSRNRVTVDLNALAHNFAQVKALLDRRVKVMGIVKSEGYGHGMLPVAKTLESEGVDSLGVSQVHEALELRKGGMGLPIVVLCGIRGMEEVRQAIEHDFTPVVYDLETAEMLNAEGQRSGKIIRVHVKVDTGMGRLGVLDRCLSSFLRRLGEFRSIYPEGLMSHLSSADERGKSFTLEQVNRFKRAVEEGRSMGLDLPFNNLANSAGIMAYPESHFQMVRPGIMLYGGLPSPDFPCPVQLKPVMSFRGRVLQVRDFPSDTPIGYGRTYYTRGPRKIAILSAGYGDGLPRSISNRGMVLIGEKRARIIGNVCMNMTMCDISGMGEVGADGEVVFMGTQGEESITGDNIAEWGDTISYEVFCSIGQRNIRKYLQ